LIVQVGHEIAAFLVDFVLAGFGLGVLVHDVTGHGAPRLEKREFPYKDAAKAKM
jgi:hypothetical protein